MGGTSAAFSGSEADNGGTTDDPDYRTVLVTRRFTRSGLAAGRSFLTFRADTAAGHHLDTIRSLWSALLLWGCLSFFGGTPRCGIFVSLPIMSFLHFFV